MSSPVQHRALHIAEVLRHICGVADNRTLAILARTCRAFQEPAIQTLWRCLTDLMPLVKCFPPDVWIIEGNKMVRHMFESIKVVPTIRTEICPPAFATRMGRLPQVREVGQVPRFRVWHSATPYQTAR